MAQQDVIAEGTNPARRTFAMTILAQDPSWTDNGGILRATVPVPADRLEPGPRSHRFHVIDYDATTGVLLPPAELARAGAGAPDWGWVEPDPFADKSDDDLLRDPAFHAQNAFAIAARTLAAFEFAIGRRLNWGFMGHELYVVPHAMAEANAYYADDIRALLLGYLPRRIPASSRPLTRALRMAGRSSLDPDAVYTCLSHDVVAHETTHAVLDGLRHRFLMPGLPDQPAFHEALADIVALLSVFSIDGVVEKLLGQANLDGRIADRSVTDAELKRNALFRLAEQVGSALKDERGSALRDSITLKPSKSWASDPRYAEPHSRGQIIVSIAMESLAQIWRQRLKDITSEGSVNRARAAEEGATAAQHLLGMSIRAIDYLPPVEFEFPDFLNAILASDAAVVPDDKHGYRNVIRDAFASWGIEAATSHLVDLSQTDLAPIYRNLSYTALRSDTDEVFRFIWENLGFLGIDPRFYVHVEHVRPSVRVGPDGIVVAETVAEYVQFLEGTPTGLFKAIGLKTPREVASGERIRVLGGGTIVFDQFGRARYHHRKDIADIKRQRRRLRYLVDNGLFDGKSLGVSDGLPEGQRFAILHQPDADRRETW